MGSNHYDHEHLKVFHSIQRRPLDLYLLDSLQNKDMIQKLRVVKVLTLFLFTNNTGLI